MKVIKTVTYQESMLVSSSATETVAAWSNATTYVKGNTVRYNNRIYESIFNGNNTNITPGTNPSYWLDIGPDNKHAMFDRKVQTGTTATGSLTVVITPGIINSIALINLNAATAKLTIRNGAGGAIVYEQLGGLSGATVEDWYQYFFYDPLLIRTQLVFKDIPPFVNSHVTLTLENDGDLSLGEFIFGTLEDLGDTQYGASAGIVDYSIKNTDAFGNTSFVERPYSKRMNVNLYMKNSNLNRVYQLLASLRAKPCVWIGAEDPMFEEPLVVYGFYKSFDIDISYPAHSMCSLEIEGLV